MPKPDPKDAPEVVSRENAIGSRTVEPGMGSDAWTTFTGPADPASHANRRDQQGDGAAECEAIVRLDELHAETRKAIRNASKPDSPAPQEDQYAGDMNAMGTIPGMTADNFPGTIEEGNVPPLPAAEPAPGLEFSPHAREALRYTVKKRLEKEGRWKEIEPIRDQMMRDCKKAMPDKEARQDWVYSELDRLYPKLPSVNDSDTISESPHLSPLIPTKAISESGQPSLPGLTDSGSIQGLSEIPEGWPVLPSNASLGAELQWVQANRLWIVEERPGRATLVRLDRAASPAPSRAALGWLETSIRSYAKFVDVAAKVSGTEDDEGAVLRRERKSVDEVRALLDEMMDAEGSCPHCGRSG